MARRVRVIGEALVPFEFEVETDSLRVAMAAARERLAGQYGRDFIITFMHAEESRRPTDTIGANLNARETADLAPDITREDGHHGEDA